MVLIDRGLDLRETKEGAVSRVARLGWKRHDRQESLKEKTRPSCAVVKVWPAEPVRQGAD